MIFSIATILLICSLICFLLAAIGIGGRVNLTAMGLFFLTLAQLFYGK